MESVNESMPDMVAQSDKDLTKVYTESKAGLMPYWSKEEINLKLEEVKNPRHKMMLLFLWFTGVRVSECIGVHKKDIDFQYYTIKIRWLKSRKYLERNIPVHPMLKGILEAYTGAMKGDDLVFPYTRVRAWQIVKQYFAGNPHKFRHSFAVNWLRQGGNIILLHQILGHKSIQHTMEYLKIVPAEQGQELMKINFL